MGIFVPLIHAIKDRIRLMDHPRRALGNGIQLRVGDDKGDFDDAIGIGAEARHFHIEPDESILILCHKFKQRGFPQFRVWLNELSYSVIVPDFQTT